MSRDNTVITNNENKSNNFENKSNKQIEEMAKIIARANGNEQDAAYYRPDATDLYNAGYRKIEEDPFRRCTCLALGCDIADDLKRDVAEEIFAEIETSLMVESFYGGEVYYAIRAEDYLHYKKKYIGKDTNVTTKETEDK